MSKWFVLRAVPGTEVQAEKRVRLLGYQAMAPYEEKLARRGKSRHPRPWRFPLYPGYLFASWENWQEGWSRITGKINPMENITAIYGFLHPVWVPMPYLLRPADVERLLSIADGKYKSDAQEVPRLKVGDTVLIPDGPFEGRSGKVTVIGGKKATVDVKGEKIVIPVEIEIAKLEKCE